MANSTNKSSTFAVTCSLLSQFMKEKNRSFRDLGLGINASLTGKSGTYQPTMTLSLLPGVDVSEDGQIDSLELFPLRPAMDVREPEKAQLTIFFGGKVLVFGNFSANTADDLMQLAANSSRTAAAAVASNAEPGKVIPNLRHVSAPAISLETVKIQTQKPTILSNLPLARKASLHRFLEKRKDRINARMPYQMKDHGTISSERSPFDTAKAEEGQTWLGLKPSLSMQRRR